jgi:malic enzyme
MLRNAACEEPRVIVVTDNEAILGIGDQGVGGMPIAIGKLALYAVGAGIHPAHCLPLDLDVGTDNATRLADPLYLGLRRRRVRGEPYLALLDELVEAIASSFPRALVQWEDFASHNAFAVLERHRRRILSFNDDIQGMGAVVVAGIRTALRQVGRALDGERIVFFGAGASGAGSALAVRTALRAAGVPEAELSSRVLCLDSRGLILADRPGLDGAKRRIAADPALVAGWPTTGATFRLADVVRLGATAVPARWLPDEAFTAAAQALHELSATARSAGDPIYPSVLRLREVSRAVAIAVGEALVEAGAAPAMDRPEIERRVAAGTWEPHYLPYRPLDGTPGVRPSPSPAPSARRRSSAGPRAPVPAPTRAARARSRAGRRG